MKHKVALFFLAVACFLPVGWRLMYQGLTEPIGLFSDVGFGCALLLISLFSPHWVRVPLLVLWVVAQAAARELILTMQRLPNWQDLQYLVDPAFLVNSTAGLNLSSPVLIILFVFSALVACCLPTLRPQRTWLLRGGILCGVLLLIHGLLSSRFDNQSVVARYNPMHWFMLDTLNSVLDRQAMPDDLSLPKGLNEL